MAFQKIGNKGFQYAPNLEADILAAEAAGNLYVGQWYSTTDTAEPKLGRAVLVNKIEWQVTTSAVAAAILVETTARMAADTALGLRVDEVSTSLDNEIQAQLLKNAAQDNALAAEVANRIAGDAQLGIDYAAADAALQTAILAAVTAQVEVLRDTTVSDLIPVVYTDTESFVLADVLGANRPDGIYAISFTSGTSVSDTATVTGLPLSAAGTGNIDFGDILRIVINGGVVTSAIKIDNIVAQKFAALDASIVTLMGATTATAIRAHFSATGFATYNPVTGVFDASLSTEGKQDIKISTVDNKPVLNVGETGIQYLDDAQVIGDSSVNVVVSDIYAKIANLNAATVGAENGVGVVAGKVELGGPLTKPTTISGTSPLNLASDKTIVHELYQPIFDTTVDGFGNITAITKSANAADVVGIWWSRSPSGNIEINYRFPN